MKAATGTNKNRLIISLYNSEGVLQETGCPLIRTSKNSIKCDSQKCFTARLTVSFIVSPGEAFSFCVLSLNNFCCFCLVLLNKISIFAHRKEYITNNMGKEDIVNSWIEQVHVNTLLKLQNS